MLAVLEGHANIVVKFYMGITNEMNKNDNGVLKMIIYLSLFYLYNDVKLNICLGITFYLFPNGKSGKSYSIKAKYGKG